MSEQLELFRTSRKVKGRKRWQSIPGQSRERVVEILAQMGKSTLQERRTREGIERRQHHESR